MLNLERFGFKVEARTPQPENFPVEVHSEQFKTLFKTSLVKAVKKILGFESDPWYEEGETSYEWCRFTMSDGQGPEFSMYVSAQAYWDKRYESPEVNIFLKASSKEPYVFNDHYFSVVKDFSLANLSVVLVDGIKECFSEVAPKMKLEERKVLDRIEKGLRDRNYDDVRRTKSSKKAWERFIKKAGV
jgi:hypothetical protein